MNTDCNVIRDLLPLYADDVCSDASRQLVEAHLQDCPDCAAVLRGLQDHQMETELKTERDDVIRTLARRFRNRSAAAGAIVAGIFAVPVLVCLIVNLASGTALSWFYIVLASMLVLASLTVVPLMAPENKLLWTFCAFCVSLVILLAVCCICTHGSWFWIASSASLFGLGLIFLPFVARAKPVKAWIGSANSALMVAAADVILFANMMNMISLGSKGPVLDILMILLCAAGFGLLAAVIRVRKGN